MCRKVISCEAKGKRGFCFYPIIVCVSALILLLFFLRLWKQLEDEITLTIGVTLKCIQPSAH